MLAFSVTVRNTFWGVNDVVLLVIRGRAELLPLGTARIVHEFVVRLCIVNAFLWNLVYLHARLRLFDGSRRSR